MKTIEFRMLGHFLKIVGIKVAVWTVLCLIASGGNLYAQSKVINLWEDKVPGAISNDHIKQTVDFADNWIKMKFVVDPFLEVYPAPADKATGTAVVICPGGSYALLAIGHEGADVAKWLNGLGITAFVLKYRLPNSAIMENKAIGPLQDGQQAIRIVRRGAKEWGIDPHKIGIMGFSAGGHLASTISTHFNEKVYNSPDSTSARPDFSLLIYPVISMEAGITHAESRENLLGRNPSPAQVRKFSNELQVNAKTPPAFLVHSMDDNAVPIQNSIGYALSLQKFKIPCELHLYESGGHGYGMGRSANSESTWPEACRKWLEERGFLKRQ
jgi:acetyl esterase/lipase